MVARYYSNTAVATTLTAAISDSAITIPVASVSGYPSTPFTGVLDAGLSSEELVEVTLVAGNNLTVERGIDGTPVAPHSEGAAFAHAVSARDFSEPQAHLSLTTSVHGISNTANLVTLSGLQTLSNKTLTSPDISGGEITSTTLLTPTIASFVNATHTHEDDASGGELGGGGVFDPAYGSFTRSSVLAVASATSTPLTVTLNSTAYNVNLGTLGDSDTTVAIAATGYYHINAYIYIESGGKAVFQLRVENGSTPIVYTGSHGDDTMSFLPHSMSLATDAHLTAGDKIRLVIQQLSGSLGFNIQDVKLCAHRIA